MNRRDFLKLSGLFSASLLLQLEPFSLLDSLPVEIEANGKVYRGTSDGDFFVSEDRGRTWTLHTRFGAQFSIAGLSSDIHNQVVGVLEYLGYTFQLTLSNTGNRWKTAA